MENVIGNAGLNTENEVNQVVDHTSRKGLWNPKGFLILSILFSFLPAAILYSLNYGRLGFSKKRDISLATSIIAFVGLVFIAFLIDKAIVKSLFYGLNIGVAVFMNNDQSKIFKEHIKNGGRKASYIVPITLSLVFTAGLLYLIFYSINIPDQKLMFNGNELYYTKTVEKSEAERLGTYLSKQGFFSNDKNVSVKIDKQTNTYKFSLIIDKTRIEDSELVQFAKELSHELSSTVFNNNKVDINFCDDVFKPLKTISD